MGMNKFEPVIVGFCCNECAYAAADLAGSSHFNYPTNIRIIRVPCSGQVDLVHILRAFENGADGVFVAGCLKEQCHYGTGNYLVEERVNFLKEIIRSFGIEEERLNMYFISASMANEFARVANELTEKIKSLGPSTLKKIEKKIEVSNNKRELFRDMIKSISSFYSPQEIRFLEEFKGFGEPIIDNDECLGCSACEYVCKNNALIFSSDNKNILIEHIYWKCTACGSCKDICLNDCIEINEGFDLSKLLCEDNVIKAKIDLKICEGCGEYFLPILQSYEIDRIIKTDSFSLAYLSLCLKCRKFEQAEKIRNITSQKRLDKLRNMNKYQPC